MARAAGDLRRGLPVVVYGEGRAALVAAAELLDEECRAFLERPEGQEGAAPFLAVTAARAEALKVAAKGHEAVFLAPLPDQTADDIAALADPSLDFSHPLSGPYHAEALSADAEAIGAAALKLCRQAGLLPAAAVRFLEAPAGAAEAASQMASWAASWAERFGLLAIGAADVISIEDVPAALARAAEARLPIAGAEDTRIVAFRPGDGGPEHYALVVGAPEECKKDAPLVRLHSACFTGDFLGSLKCDCGTQLRAALDAIIAEGAGVLLYMAQEGRGIGLLAKLKAYALQDQGFDTVDANLRLGFAEDERSYGPAAAMLKDLGLARVRLLTNNPEKVAGLEAEGIEVATRVAHNFPPNRHNAGYLETKKRRSGHLI